jgi:hypothetical protein
MLYEMGDGTLLTLVIKTCGKRMQAKEAFVTVVVLASSSLVSDHPSYSQRMHFSEALTFRSIQEQKFVQTVTKGWPFWITGDLAHKPWD